MSREVSHLLDLPISNEHAQERAKWLLDNFNQITKACNVWTLTLKEELIQLLNQKLPTFVIETALLDKAANTTFTGEDGQPIHPYTEKSVQIAAVLNFLGSYQVSRKDGSLYTAHPMFVDLIILLMNSTTSVEVRVKALIHDFIEEDLLRLWEKHSIDPNEGYITPNWELPLEDNLSAARTQLNTVLPKYNPGDAALDLMAPVVDDTELLKIVPEAEKEKYKQSLFIYWLNWRAEKQPETRVIKLADKIHDLLDLNYILNNPKMTEEARSKKLATKLAKVFFSMYHLTHNQDNELQPDVPKQLWAIFLNLVTTRLKKFSISTDEGSLFHSTYLEYLQHYTSNTEIMSNQCTLYAQKVGLSV